MFLAFVICPFTPHPFRGETPFLLLIETPPLADSTFTMGCGTADISNRAYLDASANDARTISAMKRTAAAPMMRSTLSPEVENNTLVDDANSMTKEVNNAMPKARQPRFAVIIAKLAQRSGEAMEMLRYIATVMESTEYSPCRFSELFTAQSRTI